MSQLEKSLRSFFVELGVPEKEWEDRGLDITNTPARVARMYRDELLSSYRPGAEAELRNTFTCFDAGSDNTMVTIGPIDVTSLCAHHMLPFSGVAYVGYIPGDYLVGASKIPRVVDFYSRMLQIQERLSRQIAEFIYINAKAQAVLVLLRTRHSCMVCRGVKKRAEMVTTALQPVELLREVVNEFYEQIRLLQA